MKGMGPAGTTQLNGLFGPPSGQKNHAEIVTPGLTVRHAPADLSPAAHPLICAHVERNAQPNQTKRIQP